MNRRHFLYSASSLLVAPHLIALRSTNGREQIWIHAAEAMKPALHRETVLPTSAVRAVSDSSKFFQWRMEGASSQTDTANQLMRGGDSFILDFGRHLTGYFAFSIDGEGRGIDSPTRLKLTFGEIPAEVAQPLDPYTGTLSRAWLQDETINIDVLPAKIEMPRRYAFRYVKVDVVATSPNYAVRLKEFSATAVTSAGINTAQLPVETSLLLKQIDSVSIATLRDCMQTVFEDGPKRDRRLWIGDLRLQALTNYMTFRNFQLVKRCLYLFAGFPREDGFLPACVFETPRPHRGHEYIIDYASLYGAAVVDYAEASGDWATAAELWPVVRRQMEILSSYVGKDFIFRAPEGSWVFIDWSEVLNREASMQGVFIYSLDYAARLAERVGAKEVEASYRVLIRQLSAAARTAFWDTSRRVFVSGSQHQVSLASQAWMTLSGVASKEEAGAALRNAIAHPEVVMPGGPYLYHYVADAMIHCGMKAEALSLIKTYWGGMVEAGADTFWEVFDPKNPGLSPYNNVQVNSYCHAWSCTPAYLLRSGNLI